MVGPSAAPAIFNAGSTSPGGSSGTYTGITAVQVAVPQSGRLSSLSVYWNTATGINFLLGLYNDSSGKPNALLASSAVSTSKLDWNKLPITSGPTVGAGNYWVAVQNQSGISGNYVAAGAGAWNNGVTWTGALPATWPFVSSGAFQYSMYATFNE
jgi:hypothetical protein